MSDYAASERHCGTDAIRERDRWVCPSCRAWRWVRPRDAINRWRQPTHEPSAKCPTCKSAGVVVDHRSDGYRRFRCAYGHRWTPRTAGRPKRGSRSGRSGEATRFSTVALMIAMGAK